MTILLHRLYSVFRSCIAAICRYFQGEDAGRIDYGFFSMGVVTIIIAAASTIPIYFPESGGMLFKAGALGESGKGGPRDRSRVSQGRSMGVDCARRQ